MGVGVMGGGGDGGGGQGPGGRKSRPPVPDASSPLSIIHLNTYVVTHT